MPNNFLERTSAVVGAVSRRDHNEPADVFHEGRIRRDLASLANAPGLFSQYAERVRIRFQKANERAVLEQWISHYQSAARLVAAMTELERRKVDYLQLTREYDVKNLEREVVLSRLEADREEHALRRDKAAYQRGHIDQFVEGGRAIGCSENERKLKDADERRLLDCRWELHESLRSLRTLIELQHWRRHERDRILADRSLTAEEQAEDLQFVDDLYQQKRAELKVDARIFEEE